MKKTISTIALCLLLPVLVGCGASVDVRTDVRTTGSGIATENSDTKTTMESTDTDVYVSTSAETERTTESMTETDKSETATGTPTSTVQTEASTTDPSSGQTEEKKKVSSFTMLTAGDNLLHAGLLKDGREHRGEDENFNFDFVYEKIKEQVSAADYAIINQESIILAEKYLPKGTVEQKYYRSDGSFVTPVEMLGTLKRTGFDAFDMANNHALDMGSAGLQWSLDYLRGNEDELLYFGAYYDDEDRSNIRVIEINGIKVALLAYTYGTNVPADRAHDEEPDFRFVVPYIDDEKMIEELKAANEIADFTAVFVHWGTEYSFEPDELQKHTAELLAQNGAGIIIGHHSHTLQPIEYISDGKGGEVLCAYGLGTLVSNMDTDMNMLSGLFTFTLNMWDDGSVTVSDPLLTPTVFFYNMEYRGSELLYLSEMTDEKAAGHGIGNYPRGAEKRNDMTVERLYEYLHSSIDNAFLPEEYRK